MNRICFVSGVISRSGGTERIGTIIANALANEGFEVHVLSFWNQGEPHYPLNEKIKLFYLLDPKKEGKLYRTGIYPIIKLHNFIKKNNIELLIDIDTVLSNYSSFAIQGTKCKLIAWEHFNYWSMNIMNERKRFRAKKLIKKYASGMVTLTDEDKLKHDEVYNLPEDFITTINNPCLSDCEVNYDFNSHIFLSVGRLSAPKGYDLLLKAWKLVQNKVEDWKLVIVGDGELKSELLELSEDLELERISFVGHSDCIEQYYQNAACYVMSSRYEGFPMVLLEAQSYGLPVISFDCKTGPKELIVDHQNGYLVEPENVVQLAECMTKFIESEDAANKMSEISLSNINKFKLDAIVKQWVYLINKTLGE